MPKSRGRRKEPNRVRRQTRPTLSPAGLLPIARRSADPVNLAADIAPGITARVARAADLDRFHDLVRLTGTTADDYLLEMLRSPALSTAVLAGAEHGHDQFRLELAKCMSGSETLELAALATALPLVAVTADDEIVGALLAYSPPNVIEQFLNSRRLASKKDNMMMFAGAIMSLVKLRALAVDSAWRGRGIGAGLLTRFQDVYLACRYFYLYGQFRTADAGLADFYSSHGFTILPPGEGLDLYIVFGVSGGVKPEPGEQIFYYRRAD
ncbi:GNAT family N-acetyltransferase [Kribbella sp. NPDC026611]|uniref:GNAT family N-acetyltransferase n=1 Tax=Kribbella sp. NPDC026611 TaxID=3154911 RepID=UPI0033C8951F